MAGEYAADVVADLRLMVAQGLARWGLPRATAISLLNLSENATFALGDPAGGVDGEDLRIIDFDDCGGR